ncbi:hypothetical protein ACSLBF_09595 [Pseudoalteromonas sp. T1lg65]|uniref:hypothetical protein n=1 Tax=Pseudoalteromonas sp. T1lg65 TaxID=2077101 RepID=UPI003F7AABE5
MTKRTRPTYSPECRLVTKPNQTGQALLTEALGHFRLQFAALSIGYDKNNFETMKNDELDRRAFCSFD